MAYYLYIKVVKSSSIHLIFSILTRYFITIDTDILHTYDYEKIHSLWHCIGMMINNKKVDKLNGMIQRLILRISTLLFKVFCSIYNTIKRSIYTTYDYYLWFTPCPTLQVWKLHFINTHTWTTDFVLHAVYKCEVVLHLKVFLLGSLISW